MPYLGVPHPFRDTLVYTWEPQGLRNVSEHGYNKLAVIYGDMVAEGKLIRMADGIYLIGDSEEEFMNNFLKVLIRANNCGFTFKPP